MADQRKKDVNWIVCEPRGHVTFDAAKLAVLMDIRDELKRMNSVLNCLNFLAIPEILRRISRNTAKPRKTNG